AAGPGQARDQANADRVGVTAKNDWDRAGGLLGGKAGWRAYRDDDVDLLSHQIGGKIIKLLGVAFGKSALNDEILTLPIAKLLKLVHERLVEESTVATSLTAGVEQANFDKSLCVRDDRPRRCSAAEKRNKLSSFHRLHPHAEEHSLAHR
ncbi:MAG TPA: hypothetical protein VGU64_02550, partial [Terriglobales bacterium]|nr:hypothetical protein [Terriglobales bacterium]